MMGVITPLGEDRSLLRALEEEIPILEEKLRAMKVTRKSLKAKFQMRANRKNRAFNAKVVEAVRARNATPEAREHWEAVRNNGDPLPWQKGTPEHYRFRALTRKGWSRPEAIEIVKGERA